MKLIDADALIEKLESNAWNIDEWELPFDHVTAGLEANAMDRETVEGMPTIDAVPVVRCKDCKHRPTIDGEWENGFDVKFPDGRCPCQCDDGWYNWMPRDDWFCGNGERKEED